MGQIFLILGSSFLVTFLIFPIFINLFKRRNFLDDPGGRKIHKAKTPAMGGLPIFIGFVISILIWAPLDIISEVKFFLGSLSIVFIVGLRDDLINLRAIQKLFGQIASALVIVIVSDIRFSSLYGLFGINEVPLLLGYVISVFTIIAITNAFNLIDGIDGLSGSVGLIATLFFGVWFFLNEQTSFALLCIALVGGLTAFLNFNWAPSKIFMGDTGSLFIGFFISVITIKFIDTNYALRESSFGFQGSLGTAVAVLILPLSDTTRVFVRRLLKGKSPMHPDRTHLHHILLRLGCNHAQATGVLITVNVIFVLLALVLKDFGDLIVLPTILVTAFLLGMILELIFRSTIDQRKEELRARNRAMRDDAKIVSMNNKAG